MTNNVIERLKVKIKNNEKLKIFLEKNVLHLVPNPAQFWAEVPIFVEQWGGRGIISNFTPILPYFQHWVFTKKKVFTKNGTFFPEFKWTPTLRYTHQSQMIGGDADVDHSPTIGDIQSNYWGDISRDNTLNLQQILP